jgi:glycosyltransferase involved in cell wall biosynthesis
LLSAYDAPSHRYWRESLGRYCPQHRFTQLALPPRYFSWRIRGNSLSWAFTCRRALMRDYDLLVVTSQVDLSALRGFVPGLGNIPTLLYFHENQFAYPLSDAAHGSLEPRIVNLYSALCADMLVFNSAWNQRSFLAGVDELLHRLPDQVPPGLVDRLDSRAHVLPVPIEPVYAGAGLPQFARRRPGARLQVVWNHRWEYDKGPETLLAAVTECIQNRVPVNFHIVGQQFRNQPAPLQELEQLLRLHPDYLGHWGTVTGRQNYYRLLERADVVLSTALHEFQGVAVMEAVARGCQPLVPDRLSYPELFPARYRYRSTPQQPQLEGAQIADSLLELAQRAMSGGDFEVPDMTAYGWQEMAPDYERLFLECHAGGLRSRDD